MKTINNVFICSLIMFNFLHFPIHASQEKKTTYEKHELISLLLFGTAISPNMFNVPFPKFSDEKEDDSISSMRGRSYSYRDSSDVKNLKESPLVVSQKNMKSYEKQELIASSSVFNVPPQKKESSMRKSYSFRDSGGVKDMVGTQKNLKSIWLIRHGEKDWIKTKYYLDHFKERNYEWALSVNGLEQSRRVARVLKEKYANFTTPPLVFVSPFRRTIQTGQHVAYQVNSKMKIEDGLAEKHHGLWDRVTIFDYFSNYLKLFDMDYKSKFNATKDITSPIRARDNVTFSETWTKDVAFDKNVANYFLKMLYTGKQDIIIIGHQTELYNIQRVITGVQGHSKTAFEKIGVASMFQYVLNSKSKKLELNSNYLKGFKIPDLL